MNTREQQEQLQSRYHIFQKDALKGKNKEISRHDDDHEDIDQRDDDSV